MLVQAGQQFISWRLYRILRSVSTIILQDLQICLPRDKAPGKGCGGFAVAFLVGMIGANVQLKDGLHTRSSTSRPVSPISVLFLISMQASLGRLSLNYSHLKSYKTVEKCALCL